MGDTSYEKYACPVTEYIHKLFFPSSMIVWKFSKSWCAEPLIYHSASNNLNFEALVVMAYSFHQLIILYHI